MTGEKPTLGVEYEAWLAEKQSLLRLGQFQRHYETVATEARNYFQGSSFWRELLSKLRQEYDPEYAVASRGYYLITGPDPVIFVKPYTSFLRKTYRKNVLANANWPEPPEGGWLLPPDSYSKVGDIIRTTIVVKYLDGVPFIVEKIKALATAMSTDVKTEFVAQTDGYYAAHVDWRQAVAVSKIDWHTEVRDMSFEIQITTQIKDVIKQLLHAHYEATRLHEPSDPSKWGWNYASEEFVSAYLGHILHYVDGMIISVREKARKVANGT